MLRCQVCFHDLAFVHAVVNRKLLPEACLIFSLQTDKSVEVVRVVHWYALCRCLSQNESEKVIFLNFLLDFFTELFY